VDERLVDGIEIVRIATGEVVHVVPIDPPRSHVEKTLAGMLINLHEDFYLREHYV
jgi:hypothetical protein